MEQRGTGRIQEKKEPPLGGVERALTKILVYGLDIELSDFLIIFFFQLDTRSN
jgi:hypothetical protein